MTSRSQFLAAVMATMGTPFAHRGRLVGVGLDCAGMILASLADCGLAKAEPRPYGPYPGSVLADLADHFVRVDEGLRRAGDVVAILWDQEPRHLAVIKEVCSDGADVIVHALARVGCVASHHLRSPFVAHSHWCLREFL